MCVSVKQQSGDNSMAESKGNIVLWGSDIFGINLLSCCAAAVPDTRCLTILRVIAAP